MGVQNLYIRKLPRSLEIRLAKFVRCFLCMKIYCFIGLDIVTFLEVSKIETEVEKGFDSLDKAFNSILCTLSFSDLAGKSTDK